MQETKVEARTRILKLIGKVPGKNAIELQGTSQLELGVPPLQATDAGHLLYLQSKGMIRYHDGWLLTQFGEQVYFGNRPWPEG
jgi:hypothetical protein